MIFWLSVTALCFLAMLLLWRSWTARLRQGIEVDDSDNRHYTTKIADIDRDLVLGKIDAAEAEAAKAEAGRQLIRVQQTIKGRRSASKSASGWWMTIALVFIPSASILVYYQTGNPPTISRLQQTEAPAPEMSINQLVAVVEKRLQDFPDDAQGWRVIAPVYMRQQRYADAEMAFRNILRIEGESSAVLGGLGEILVQKSGGIIDEQAIGVFRKALELDADNAIASFYLGEAELQNGNPERAIARWESMLEDAQGNEEWLPMITSRIAAVKRATTPAKGETAPAIDEEQAESILALPEEDRLTQINAMVEGLAARLESEPEDREGWVRLVRSYMVLGRAEDALAARKKAEEIFPSDGALKNELDEIMNEMSTRPNTEGDG